METQLTQKLLSFASDHLWIHENRDVLLRQYSNQWIGVKSGQVIASDPDLTRLLSRLSDPAYTCVEFMTGEPLEMVL